MSGQSISVILPNYNHADLVGHAVACFRQQTRPPDELIVIDDGSTDDSIERINDAIRGMANAQLLRNDRNRGVVETLNRGIAESTGDWILLGAADDEYDCHMLEWLSAPLSDHADVGLVCGNAVDSNVATKRTTRVPLPFGDAPTRLEAGALVESARRRNFLFFTGACLISRRALERAGRLDPGLRWHCDWLVNFVIAFRQGAFYVPRDVLFLSTGMETYSAGRHNPDKQRPVIHRLVTVLTTSYPDVFPAFRKAGLLPTYEAGTLPVLMADSRTCRYLTPLLIWRLLMYRTLRFLGRQLPETLRVNLRRHFRV